jgi:hypothetical protein
LALSASGPVRGAALLSGVGGGGAAARGASGDLPADAGPVGGELAIPGATIGTTSAGAAAPAAWDPRAHRGAYDNGSSGPSSLRIGALMIARFRPQPTDQR